VYDDQFNPAQGILRVREAAAAGAVAIMGPYGSTQWETAAPLLNQLKMPGFNLSATKPGITVPPYSLRVSHPDDKSTPEGLAEFVKLLPGIRRVAVMGDVREASGRAVIDQWVALAKAAGLEVVDVLTYTSTQTDLSPYAIKLKELQPDALLVGMLPADAIRFSRELHIQGVKFPVLANAMIYSGVFPQRWYVVGFTTNEYASGDPEKHRRFVQMFTEEVNKDPALSQFQPPNVANSSLGYDGVLLIADMLSKQGVDGNTPVQIARDKLRDAMTQIKHFRGVNEFFFDNKGEGAPQTKLLRVDPARGMYILANP
jgi:branched-chain amino acid transport system substrate-binding protein